MTRDTEGLMVLVGTALCAAGTVLIFSSAEAWPILWGALAMAAGGFLIGAA